jgi:hypothetical protein
VLSQEQSKPIFKNKQPKIDKITGFPPIFEGVKGAVVIREFKGF